MNFSDLPARLITGLMLCLGIGLWIFLSIKYPIVFHIGLTILASICLYEWFRMGAGKSILLRLVGAAIIGFGFWACHWFWAFYRIVNFNTRQYPIVLSFFLLILLLGPITDTAAYFGGRIMGGPKLCPVISPSKTWAGFLSAVLLVPVLAFLYLISYTYLPLRYALYGTLGTSLLCLAAQTGDLMESWAKRKFGVKDSGSWLPGHGGLLDRLDSTLAIAIAFFVIARISLFVLTYCTAPY